MLTIRKSQDRGHANHGWLDSYHTFSFANYYDPKNMGFSVLRVINEDWIDANMGFGAHPHNDMEIITYVMEGSLQHKDSMGNTAVIKPGEVQHMSAGTGILHSEFNPSKDQKTHLLQIWILPDREGHKPRYGQKSFAEQFEKNDLTLVVSHKGEEGSIPVHQDMKLYVGKAKKGFKKSIATNPERKTWIQVTKGTLKVNDSLLSEGDAAAIAQVDNVQIQADPQSEFLLFDLPH